MLQDRNSHVELHRRQAVSTALDRAWRAMAFAYEPGAETGRVAKKKLASVIEDLASEGQRDPQALCDIALGRTPPIAAYWLRSN